LFRTISNRKRERAGGAESRYLETGVQIDLEETQAHKHLRPQRDGRAK
jgi:hypothetical protein